MSEGDKPLPAPDKRIPAQQGKLVPMNDEETTLAEHPAQARRSPGDSPLNGRRRESRARAIAFQGAKRRRRETVRRKVVRLPAVIAANRQPLPLHRPATDGVGEELGSDEHAEHLLRLVRAAHAALLQLAPAIQRLGAIDRLKAAGLPARFTPAVLRLHGTLEELLQAWLGADAAPSGPCPHRAEN
jgi:hypothetical protein